MIPKHKMKHEENVDSWLMSYADMITLLLCFFIIFVSVSEPKKDKITNIAEGLQGKFGSLNYSTPLLGAVRALQASVEKHELYRDVAVENTSSSLNVELATQSFFQDGGVEIAEDKIPVLNEMIAGMKQSDLSAYTIAIESHTDDTPPKSGLYKNNWELSALRAGKIAEYFVRQGFNPAQVKAVGFADSRPKVPNLDEKGQPIEANRARNNRVTIKLESAAN